MHHALAARRHDFAQEPDSLATGTVLVVLAVAIVVCLACAAATWGEMRVGGVIGLSRDAHLPPGRPGVLQTLIEPSTGHPDAHAAERTRLASYGWVDRERGIVHIPIERAMAMLAAGEAGR
jgi:hypothetical protein